MLQKILLALLVVWVSGCRDKGPDLTYCTVDPKGASVDHKGQCANRAGEPGEVPLSKLDNYACVSPRDRQEILEACQLNLKKNAGIRPTVTYCVIDCKKPLERCEGQCSDGVFGVSWPIESMANYVCLSPIENQTLLRFCKMGTVKK